jgi:predicted nucleotidyltransferase
VIIQESPNRDRLLRTARRIRPVLEDVVFVGGQTTELLLTDPAGPRLRPTDDVDVIVRVTTRTAYHLLQGQLRELGFEPDSTERAPICRMRTKDDLVLDVMPLDEKILGFTNRWYPYAIETAWAATLEEGLEIRVISAPAFLATKWEAFESRGEQNMLMSHDVEDIIALVAGRPSVMAEVQACAADVRSFVAAQTAHLLNDPSAEEIVEDALPDARHVRGLTAEVMSRLHALAQAE